METSPFTERVARELRAEMARQQRTVVDMAAVTGRSAQTLHRRLSGRTAITTDDLALFSAYLQVAPDTVVRRALPEAVG